jgi:predicted amidophosphoribosyltransferase
MLAYALVLGYAGLLASPLVYRRVRGWRIRRLERRYLSGVCLNCGYDLRSSLERCPECGWQVRRVIGRYPD